MTNAQLAIKLAANRESSQNFQGAKKRKISPKKCENDLKIAKIAKNLTKNEKVAMLEEAYKSGLISYIKALLEASRTLPNVIKILDSIIEKRASSLITPQSIYGSEASTLSEVNKVIDLSSRKDKLINIYLMTKDMLSFLSGQTRHLVVYKFVRKLGSKEIMEEMGMSERTLYRSVNRAIDQLAIFMLSSGWDAEFVKRQIGDEPWIRDLAAKKSQDAEVNNIRATKNQKKIAR